MEPGRRALVMEFYANLGDRNLLRQGEMGPFWRNGHLPTADLDKEAVHSMRNSRRTPILQRSLESSLVAKGNGRE